MNEEESEAIEYSKNCLMKITLGIDCEFDVNILDTLLNIIKKLQKQNEELKADLYNANLIINEYVDTYKDCISKEIELSSEDVKAMLEKPEKYFKIRTACYKE